MSDTVIGALIALGGVTVTLAGNVIKEHAARTAETKSKKAQAREDALVELLTALYEFQAIRAVNVPLLQPQNIDSGLITHGDVISRAEAQHTPIGKIMSAANRYGRIPTSFGAPEPFLATPFEMLFIHLTTEAGARRTLDEQILMVFSARQCVRHLLEFERSGDNSSKAAGFFCHDPIEWIEKAIAKGG